MVRWEDLRRAVSNVTKIKRFSKIRKYINSALTHIFRLFFFCLSFRPYSDPPPPHTHNTHLLIHTHTYHKRLSDFTLIPSVDWWKMANAFNINIWSTDKSKNTPWHQKWLALTLLLRKALLLRKFHSPFLNRKYDSGIIDMRMRAYNPPKPSSEPLRMTTDSKKPMTNTGERSQSLGDYVLWRSYCTFLRESVAPTGCPSFSGRNHTQNGFPHVLCAPVRMKKHACPHAPPVLIRCALCFRNEVATIVKVYKKKVARYQLTIQQV